MSFSFYLANLGDDCRPDCGSDAVLSARRSFAAADAAAGSSFAVEKMTQQNSGAEMTMTKTTLEKSSNCSRM